ncbi:hypothetical protein OAR97_01765 [Arcobacteraceae bacterium]|nr:hypothetical protein [Arcobacteraceae bacterium]
MKRELGIFIGLLLFLTIGMHFSQLIEYPLEHLSNLQNGGAFGIPGLIHPLVFTLIVYVIIGVPRLIGKIFSRKI